VTTSTRSQRRRQACRSSAALTLPSHWSPTQALAVFECLEMIRQQLWLAYATDIQKAWRSQLVRQRAPPDLDPELPF
jgi:hypothetical protein